MKSGLTFIAALAFSATVFANGNQTTTPEKWNGSINKSQLGKYLKAEMRIANRAKEGNNEKIRKAVYGNLKLMKNTLNEKQYSDYLKLMGMTLRNKGIDIEKK